MESAETLANLQKFLTLLDPSLHLDEMLTNVTRQLVDMFQVDHSGMLLFAAEDTEGVVIAEYPAQGAVGLKVPLTDYPLIDRLRREQRPLAITDAQNAPIMGSARPIMRRLGIKSIVIIPLVARGKIVGSLSLDAVRAPRRFTVAEIELCHIIGTQIAVAVDYTFSLEAMEAGRRQAQTLREVNRVLSQSLDLSEVLTLILVQLEQVLPVDGSSIYLRVDGEIALKAYRGKEKPTQVERVVPLSKLWGASEIFNSKQVVLVRNTEQHPHWHAYNDTAIKSWLGVPLTVRDQVVGILNMNGYTANQFNESHIQLAADFANQAAIAIHNAELYGQATERAELVSSIQEIGISIMSSLELEEVLVKISTSVLDLLDAHHVRIFLYDPGSDYFSVASALNKGGALNVNINPPRKNGLTAYVARSGQVLAIADIREHYLYQELKPPPPFRAVIGVPLKKKQQVLAVLSVSYRQPHRFIAEEIDLLRLLATQAAVALENARLYDLEVKQIEQELSIARRIQQGFLPHEIPTVPGWQIAAVCLPARETAGDFYEFVRRRDGCWGLAIGDVSGKSIQAAMLMGAAQSVVAAKGSDHRSPARVMTETNRLLYEDVPDGSFVAVSYALVSANDNQLSFSNGGQLAPFLVPASNRPIQLIETPGSHWPLGIIEEVEYQELCLSLEPGDLMVFFTDGLIERMNEQQDLFSFEGAAAVLEKCRGQPPQAVLETLLQAANSFAGGLNAHDDVTLLIVQRMDDAQ